MDDLKPCPFCGGEDVEHLPDGFGNWLVGCVTCDYRIQCVDCTEEEAIRYWNTRPAEDKKNYDLKALNFIYNKQAEAWENEIERLKAENAELRYIVKQFEQWRGDDDTGCPRYQHPDYHCPGEKEFKKKFGEEADFDSIECDEWGEGCWVEYYRWKFRQKNNAPDTEKGGDDE